MIKYTGFIRQVRFYSESSYYIVAVVECEEEEHWFTLNGYMSQFNDYDKYCFYGDWQIHPKYGKQFKMERYEVVLSDDKEEIVKYLSSPLFKGVGKVLAGHIVDTLGKDCLQKIIDDKHCLDQVKSMTELKRETIYQVLSSQNFDQEVTAFFMGHGISLKNLGLIQAKYKDKTLEVLQNNPYQLIEDIDGIGFKTADELALKIGGSPEDPHRIKAAIIYSIKQIGFSTGSTYVSLGEIKKMMNQLIFQIDDQFEKYLDELIEEEKVILEDDRYYYYEMYQAEKLIASFIQQILHIPDDIYDQNEVDQFIENKEKQYGIQYAKKQKEAINHFLKYPFMILTGGPGTGKTTIVKLILDVYHQLYPQEKIGLVAPTGRASKRLSELTGLEACTIHRELKWDLHSNTFAMDHSHPLDYDVLIVDEFSMVDCLLLSKLLDASNKIHKLLFIGDYHQLPSVAPGNVLKDLIQLDLHVIELDEIFRQSKDSGIIQLAHSIIHNQLSDLSLFENYSDIHFFKSTNYDMVKNVTTIVKKAIKEGYDIYDIQVLAPMYQGVAGIDALNDALQEVFNPANENQLEYKVGRRIFRVGDKILQLKNRPEDDVYNGDIGILIDICKKDNMEYLEDTLIVDYDGRIVMYTSKDFYTITLAYCMSIHKSQGSEFKIVIMSVLNDYSIMLKRNLLYTALTRAKQSLFILGDPQAFIRGIQYDYDERRKTSLIQQFQNNQTLNLYDFMDDDHTK